MIKRLAAAEGELVRKGQKLAEIEQTEVNAQVEQARQACEKAKRDVARGERLYADKVISLEQLQDLRTQAAMAEAALNSAQFNWNYAAIVAPRDGTVLRRLAEEREVVAAGAPVLVLGAQDRGFVVRAGLADREIVQVRIGDAVRVRLDALPDARFRGQVGGIVPTVDRAKATVMTKIRFEKLDARILPEMSAKVTFLSQPATDADQRPVLAVNPEAVTERGGAKVVLRLAKQGEEEVLEAVEVTPGRRLGDLLEVSSGTLKSGERLVLKPADTLQAGTKVAVAAK